MTDGGVFSRHTVLTKAAVIYIASIYRPILILYAIRRFTQVGLMASNVALLTMHNIVYSTVP